MVYIVGIAGVFAGIALHYISRGHRYPGSFRQHLRRTLMDSFRILVLLGSLLGLLGLAVTGFGPACIGHELEGYFLMMHVSAGGFFAFMIGLLALTRAEDNRIGKYRYSEHPLMYWQSGYFWLFLASSLLSLVTIIVSMTKVFGTDGQEFLAGLHPVFALLAFVSGIVYFYLIFLGNRTNKR